MAATSGLGEAWFSLSPRRLATIGACIMSITLILGGARSGKSAHAEYLASQSGKQVVYLATAPHLEGDEAWEQRIAEHQARRPSTWLCIEESLDIADIYRHYDHRHIILVDCMTLWLSNLIWEKRDVSASIQDLCAILTNIQADIIMVSNELGMGLVPEHTLSREFRDAQGRLNQSLAKVAHDVAFVVAGLPMMLKGEKR